MDAVRFGPLEVTVEVGSIVEVEPRPDVLVSSDDNYLGHGGGVSQEIWQHAGPALPREVAELSLPLRLGDIVETGSGTLGARLFHAVTIDFDQNQRIGGPELQRLLLNVLARAEAGGHRSVAQPLLGTGKAGVSFGVAMRALADTLASFARLPPRTLARVVVAVPEPTVAADLHEALRARAAAPSIERLVEAAAARAPTKIAREMRDAANELASDRRGWGLVQLNEQALRALGSEALAALEKQNATTTDDPPALLAGLDPSLQRRLLRSDGHLAAELPPGLSMGQSLAAVRALRPRAGLDLARAVDAALASAVESRNRFAHGEPEAAIELERALLTVYESLAGDQTTATEPHSELGAVSSAVGVPAISSMFGTALGMLVRSMAKGHSEPPVGVAPPAPVLGSIDDGAHVRALVDFLRARLSNERLSELDVELAALGYEGEPDLKLLEYAVRHEHPATWLDDEFTKPTLRTEVAARTGAQPDARLSSQALAEELLQLLGFPKRRSIHGLTTSIRFIETERTRIHGVTTSELRGLALACADHLERTVLVLLRFICKAAFDLPPEQYFRREHPTLLPDNRPLDRSSLGTILQLLERLADDFEKSEDTRVAVLRSDLQSERLVPKNANAIAQLRNAFAHVRDESPKPLEDLRNHAQTFLDAALELLRYFQRADHRVFPHVIRVRSIRIDAWRRRVVEAEDESGHTEYIFTSQAMQPGEVYYMHPLTNPFRVDPILVEAGDLASKKPAG